MPSPEDLHLRRRLRELIEEQSTISRVADELGMSSSSQLYQFFSGARGLNWSTLERVLNHCGIVFAHADD